MKQYGSRNWQPSKYESKPRIYKSKGNFSLGFWPALENILDLESTLVGPPLGLDMHTYGHQIRTTIITSIKPFIPSF